MRRAICSGVARVRAAAARDVALRSNSAASSSASAAIVASRHAMQRFDVDRPRDRRG